MSGAVDSLEGEVDFELDWELEPGVEKGGDSDCSELRGAESSDREKERGSANKAGMARAQGAGRPEPRSEQRSFFSRLKEALRTSAKAQAAILAVAGIAAVVLVPAPAPTKRPEARSHTNGTATVDGAAHPFPKLELRGADPVKVEDIETLFRRPKPGKGEGIRSRESDDAATDSRPEGIASAARDKSRPLVALKPGELIDDSSENGVVVFDPDAERRTSEKHRPASAADRPTREARRTSGRFFAPGGLLAGAAKKRNQPDGALGLKAGDRFKVKLEIGIVSSVKEEVMASVLEDVEHSGTRTLRAGDVLKGRASNDDRRIFIRFQSIETNGRRVSIAAYAVERKMPGLRATRREATLEERSKKSVAGEIVGGAAREAGAILAEGSAVGRIAEGAASGLGTEAQRDLKPDTSWVLEVPAGRTFEVVITESR